MSLQMDSLLYAILGSLLRNRFASPLWIRQTDTQGRGSLFRHGCSLRAFPLLLLPSPPSNSRRLLPLLLLLRLVISRSVRVFVIRRGGRQAALDAIDGRALAEPRYFGLLDPLEGLTHLVDHPLAPLGPVLNTFLP